MLLKLLLVIFLGTLTLKGAVYGAQCTVNLQEINVQASSANCDSSKKGLMRMVDGHLEFCHGTAWAKNSPEMAGINCKDIKTRDPSSPDGLYWVDPDAGSHSDAFLVYCDMKSFGGGWTMCYSTNDKVKPKTEVTYYPQHPYGTNGYRTNCNNIPFTEILWVDHQTGAEVYFKSKTDLPITAAANYGNAAATGLWHGVGASNALSYQLLICDHSFYSGFFVSGFTSNCYKQCNSWCGDTASPYFRTASLTHASYRGVAFNTNGHSPNIPSNRLVSVGLR